MSDVLELASKILELFKENDLTKTQSMFVLKAVEMTVHEEMMKEVIKSQDESDPSYPGVV